MAETEAETPFATCLGKLKSYVRTRKGTILAAEIVSCNVSHFNLMFYMFVVGDTVIYSFILC